jgi:hypothetical protein
MSSKNDGNDKEMIKGGDFQPAESPALSAVNPCSQYCNNL